MTGKNKKEDQLRKKVADLTRKLRETQYRNDALSFLVDLYSNVIKLYSRKGVKK
jgi:hypothetical protein